MKRQKMLLKSKLQLFGYFSVFLLYSHIRYSGVPRGGGLEQQQPRSGQHGGVQWRRLDTCGSSPCRRVWGQGLHIRKHFLYGWYNKYDEKHVRIIYHTLIGGLVTMVPLKLRDEVWKFDTETQTWSTMVDVKLSDPIYYHAVNIADFCPGECMGT